MTDARSASVACLVPAEQAEVQRRPAEYRVLDRREIAVEHRAEQRADESGLPLRDLVRSVGRGRGTGIERVDAARPAGVELDDGEAERSTEREVLALRVCDRHPPTEDAARSIDEALRRRRLPGAGLAGEEHVRVRDESGAVGLERIEGEATAAGEDVRAEVDAGRPQASLGKEWVGRGDVGGRRAMPAHPQPIEEPAHASLLGAIPRPTGSAQTRPRSCRPSSARSSKPGLRGDLFVLRARPRERVGVGGGHGDEARVLELGVPGDELGFTLEHG